MSIDKGPDSVNKLMGAGYVKTVAGGYTFTREGLSWLVNQIEELYHLYEQTIHTDVSDNTASGGDTDPNSEIQSE